MLSSSPKIFFYSIVSLLIVGCLILGAFYFSPWPSALIIRYAFEKEAYKTNEALQKHVPAGIATQLHQVYDADDKDALLDIYYPSSLPQSDTTLPLIVWIHGGGWISGNKSHISNYCKILASKGYVVASIDYSIAPEKHYPTPILQTHRALTFLHQHANPLHINTSFIFLAGDSGGAHIAAQTAHSITQPIYAQQLGIIDNTQPVKIAGLLLYCGPYDAENINMDGNFGFFLKTVLWSYSGTKNFHSNPLFKTASIIQYVNSHFPPCFISAGNGDPLLQQSQHFAQKLQHEKVHVDTLFFPTSYEPKLPHEYQFNLDTAAGQMALECSIHFLNTIIDKN